MHEGTRRNLTNIVWLYGCLQFICSLVDFIIAAEFLLISLMVVILQISFILHFLLNPYSQYYSDLSMLFMMQNLIRY